MRFLNPYPRSISAVTTTGLSTLGSVEDRPKTFLFARAWMQWYGDLGMVVLSLAVILHPGQSARRLALSDNARDDVLGGSGAYARRVLGIYVAMTLFGILLVWATGVGIFDSLIYVLSSVSTGGFSPDDASLSALDGYGAKVAVSVACLAGAVPFLYYIRLFRRKREGVSRIQIRYLLLPAIVILIPSLALVLLLGMNSITSWADAWRHGPLTAVSAQTTSGFSSIPIHSLDAGSELVLILSMAVGGGFGSTAGGIKLLRLFIVFGAFLHLVRSVALPSHAVHTQKLKGKNLEDGDVGKALCLVLLFASVVIVSWIPFVAMGYDPLDSLFEVVSATATVGLSTGITDSSLPAFLKAVLCADMLLGRLEIVAWLVLFAPQTWFGRRNFS